VALGDRPARVELQQLLGHLPQGRAHGFFHPLPRRAAEAIQAGGALVAAEVLGDEIQALDRQIELVALRVFEQQEVALAIPDAHRLEAEVTSDAVVLVHDEVADGEVREGGDGRAALEPGPLQRAAPRAEDVGLGQQDEAQRGHDESAAAFADDDAEAVGTIERDPGRRLEVVLPQDLPQVLGLMIVGAGQPHREPLGAPAANLVGQLAEPAGVLTDGARVEHDGLGVRGIGDQRELDPWPAAETLAQRTHEGRLFVRPVEQAWRVEDDRRRRRQVVEQRVPVGLIRRRRRQRQDDQLRKAVMRALRRGIEETDGFDLVAEELEPRRPGLARREHVDDAAAHTPLAYLDHRLHALVARVRQGFQEQLAVEAIADAEPKRLSGERGRRRQRCLERRARRHDGEGLAGHETPADQRALGVRLALPSTAPQPRLELGKLDGGRAEEPKILGPAVRIGEAGDDDQEGDRMSLVELGHGQRASRTRETGDAKTGNSLGEGLRRGVKGRPVAQHPGTGSRLPRRRSAPPGHRDDFAR
jgi:hypothetical protein